MIPLFKVFVADDQSLLNETLKSGYIGQGPKVKQFEDLLASYIDNPYVNTVNSATSGLHLALHMAKVDSPHKATKPNQKSDRTCFEHRNEVLTTPLTCTATNVVIPANGLKIKWVDLDYNTFNIDLDDLKRKISHKTLAIMVVHWGGYPVDLDKLRAIQQEYYEEYGYEIPIIEDCAHAFGSSYKNRKIGNSNNYAVFSFQAIKHLTTGDGGALFTPSHDRYTESAWYDKTNYQRAKLLRWYGLDRESSADFRCSQNILEWGYKFQMNDIAASLGIANFAHIKDIVSKHIRNEHYLREHLCNLGSVTLQENNFDRESASWIFTMHVKNRDDFMKYMTEKGIATSRVHDRNDKHECFKEFKSYLPTTDLVCKDMCCIPCGWWLTQENLEYIVDTIKKGW